MYYVVKKLQEPHREKMAVAETLLFHDGSWFHAGTRVGTRALLAINQLTGLRGSNMVGSCLGR